MTRTKVLTEQLVVRLPPDLLRALNTQAKDEGRTVAQVVRSAIWDYLDGGPA